MLARLAVPRLARPASALPAAARIHQSHLLNASPTPRPQPSLSDLLSSTVASATQRDSHALQKAGSLSLTRATASTREFHLYIVATRNNTLVHLQSHLTGNIAWATGGSVGFRNAARSGYEAGYQTALNIFKRIEDLQKDGPLTVQLWFKGFGQGREAFFRALMAAEGEVVRGLVTRITDYTPIKIGGTRSKKRRVL